jgi:hypothetical protein
VEHRSGGADGRCDPLEPCRRGATKLGAGPRQADGCREPVDPRRRARIRRGGAFGDDVTEVARCEGDDGTGGGGGDALVGGDGVGPAGRGAAPGSRLPAPGSSRRRSRSVEDRVAAQPPGSLSRPGLAGPRALGRRASSCPPPCPTARAKRPRKGAGRVRAGTAGAHSSTPVGSPAPARTFGAVSSGRRIPSSVRRVASGDTSSARCSLLPGPRARVLAKAWAGGPALPTGDGAGRTPGTGCRALPRAGAGLGTAPALLRMAGGCGSGCRSGCRSGSVRAGLAGDPRPAGPSVPRIGPSAGRTHAMVAVSGRPRLPAGLRSRPGGFEIGPDGPRGTRNPSRRASDPGGCARFGRSPDGSEEQGRSAARGTSFRDLGESPRHRRGSERRRPPEQQGRGTTGRRGSRGFEQGATRCTQPVDIPGDEPRSLSSAPAVVPKTEAEDVSLRWSR